MHLTYLKKAPHTREALAPRRAKAGAPGIEVTPEMVMEGADIISSRSWDLYHGWVDPADIARDVWAAMLALYLKDHPSIS